MIRTLRRAAMAGALALVSTGLFAQGTPLVQIHFDFATWHERFPQSALGQAWQDPAVMTWRDSGLATTLERLRGEGVDVEAILSALRGEVAVVLTDDFMATGQPTGAVAVHQPGEIGLLLDAIGSHLPPERIQQLQSVMLREGEDAVAFGFPVQGGVDLMNSLGNGPASLGLDAPDGTVLSARVDVSGLLSGLESQGMVPPEALPVIEALGLSDLDEVTLFCGFEGTGLSSEMTLTFLAERSGLMALVADDAPMGLGSLLPAEAIQVGSMRVRPPAEIFAWIEQLVAEFGGPTATQDLQQGIDDFQAATGLSLRDQVLPALGQEHGFVMSRSQGLSINAALVMEVTDPDVFGQLIDAVLAEVGPMTPSGQITPLAMDHGGVEFRMFTVPPLPVQFCTGFLGDHMVVAFSQAQMQAIIDAHASGENLTGSERFGEVAGHLPGEAAAYSYTDNRASFESLLQTVSPFLMMASGALPPSAQQAIAQAPAVTPLLGQSVGHLSASPTELSFRSYNTSGAESILLLMALSVGIDVALENMREPVYTQSATAEPVAETAPAEPVAP